MAGESERERAFDDLPLPALPISQQTLPLVPIREGENGGKVVFSRFLSRESLPLIGGDAPLLALPLSPSLSENEREKVTFFALSTLLSTLSPSPPRCEECKNTAKNDCRRLGRFLAALKNDRKTADFFAKSERVRNLLFAAASYRYKTRFSPFSDEIFGRIYRLRVVFCDTRLWLEAAGVEEYDRGEKGVFWVF